MLSLLLWAACHCGRFVCSTISPLDPSGGWAVLELLGEVWISVLELITASVLELLGEVWISVVELLTASVLELPVSP